MPENQGVKSVTQYESTLVTGTLTDATHTINNLLAKGWFLKIDHPEIIVTERAVHLVAVLYREPGQK